MTEAVPDSVAEAQAKVDAEKARLNATIAEIRRRADPRAMVDEVKDSALHSASQLADSASRYANAGVATVKRRPEVAGAAAGGVGLIAALYAWRKHSKNKKAHARNAKLARRVSVADVLDPPMVPVPETDMLGSDAFETDTYRMDPLRMDIEATDYPDAGFETQTTQPGYSVPVQQEAIHGQEQQ